MSARSVCSGNRPCRYHSERAISFPFKRPLTRTLIPLQPKRSAESTALRMARRKPTRFSSWSAIDSDTSCASSALLHVTFELVDLSALASNDDSRTRRLDDDAQLIAGTLDFDRADAR